MAGVGLGLAACGGGQTTYTRDLAPLIEARCISCHTEDSVAPFPLTTWAQVEALAPLIVSSVEDGSMPPWSFDPDCRNVEGSLSMSAEQVATFSKWADGGYLQGAGSTADLVADLGDSPRAPELSFVPPEAYTPDDSGVDDYRCLPVGEALEHDLWVQAVHVQPDQTALVHHVILYAVPEGEADGLDALDEAADGPGYRCFGDAGLGRSQTVGGWVPGKNPPVLVDGIATRVPRGARFVIQIHYNTSGEDPAPDATQVDLWTLPEAPAQQLLTWPITVLDLDIPAFDAASVQSAAQRIPIEGTVVATSPHMHLLGTSMSTTIAREDGSTDCLSQVDEWDFNWQRTYVFDDTEGLPISLDDEVVHTCVYDNSEFNQPIVDGLPQIAQQVGWGDGSFDEMCLNYASILTPWEDVGQEGTCAGYTACRDGCEEGDGRCFVTCAARSGESCVFCALDALDDSCITNACATQGLGLQSCMGACDGHWEGTIDCLTRTCADAFDNYAGCIDRVLDAGSCASAFRDCPEIVPAD